MEETHKLSEETQKAPVCPRNASWVKERAKPVQVPFRLVDCSEDSYKSREQWKHDFGGFPQEFYPALEAHSMGTTPKEFRNFLKKQARKGLGKKGRKK